METDKTISQSTSKTSLIGSAKDLFLKYGIKSVSMDDLASLLGISKKTIYNLVLNKSKLVEAVIRQHIKEDHKAIEAIYLKSNSAVHEMILITQHVHRTVDKMKPTMVYDLKKYHKPSWDIIEKEHYSYIRTTIERNVQRGIEEGDYRNDLDASIISLLYMGLTKIVSNENLSLEPTMTISEVYDLMIDYHLNAITNEKGKEELKMYLNKKEI